MQKFGIKRFFGRICVRKLPRIWILDTLDPLGPFGTLGPYLIFVSWTPLGPFGTLGPFGPFGPFGTLGPFGPLWALLEPLALKYLPSSSHLCLVGPIFV